MPNFKNVEIVIDRQSWPSNIPPPPILSLSGSRAVDTDLTLLHTALWTCPPTYTGFDLSDCWAWMRYQRALATTKDLRLRQEWKDIDPHQKTILSDELGVGFTTQLFIDTLGFRFYVDTRYLAKLLPEYFWLVSSNKQGPQKSPDYVAFDRYWSHSILECKGTQTSLKSLEKAIEDGVEQKKLGSLRNSKYALVAGLFIPQSTNSQKATIRVGDPVWEDLEIALNNISRDERSQRKLLITAMQISFAKHFALMGFYSMANSLMALRLDNLDLHSLRNIGGEDLEFLRSRENNNRLLFSIEQSLPPHEKSKNDDRANARRMRFRIEFSYEQYIRLIESNNIFEELYQTALNLEGKIWDYRATETSTELLSPLGFSINLDYIY